MKCTGYTAPILTAVSRHAWSCRDGREWERERLESSCSKWTSAAHSEDVMTRWQSTWTRRECSGMSKSSSQRCELGHKTMPETNEKNRECARERETTTAFGLCLWLSDTMFASVSLLCSCVSTKPKQKQTTGTPVPHACKCGMRPC